VSVNEALTKLEVSPSTYYGWRRLFRTAGREALHDRKLCGDWNRIQLLPEEPAKVLHIALLYPEWSSREISCHIADTSHFTVSEATVYWLLKEAGWIKPKDTRRFSASSEYRIKTKRPNQTWQTDATYGW
jgi:transposase